jgi:hypothetical protein
MRDPAVGGGDVGMADVDGASPSCGMGSDVHSGDDGSGMICGGEEGASAVSMLKGFSSKASMIAVGSN